MPYLIYGEDTYRSKIKLKAISQKYIDASLGDTNLAQIDGSQAKAEEIIRQLWISPFLAPKRLVIIKNFLSQGDKTSQGQIIDFIPQTPSSTIVIFYESEKIDKKISLFKILNKPKTAEEFNLLNPLQLRQFITKQFSQAEVKLDQATIEYLIKNIGPDLWRQQNEIEKIIHFCPEGATIDQVKQIINLQPQGDIFQFIDALAARDLKKAASHLKGRLALGDSPIYLFSMIIYGFRTLIIIKDSLDRNPRLTSINKIHPLVFRKTSQQIKSFSQPQLHAIYQNLRDLDYRMKTGIIDPEVAIDMFVFELCLG